MVVAFSWLGGGSLRGLKSPVKRLSPAPDGGCRESYPRCILACAFPIGRGVLRRLQVRFSADTRGESRRRSSTLAADFVGALRAVHMPKEKRGGFGANEFARKVPRSLSRLRRASPPPLGHCPCGARRPAVALVVRGARRCRGWDPESATEDKSITASSSRGGLTESLESIESGAEKVPRSSGKLPRTSAAVLGVRGAWGDRMRCAATRFKPCKPKRSADGRGARRCRGV